MISIKRTVTEGRERYEVKINGRAVFVYASIESLRDGREEISKFMEYGK